MDIGYFQLLGRLVWPRTHGVKGGQGISLLWILDYYSAELSC